MNWLDWALIAVLAVSAFAGLRMGLLSAVAIFVSLLVAWYFAGQVSSAAALGVEAYTDSKTAQAVVTVISYLVLLAVVLFAAGKFIKMVKSVISSMTLGLSNVVDRVGGLVLGFVVGVMVVGAVVLILARLTYQIDLSAVDTSGQTFVSIEEGEGIQEELQRLLSESQVTAAVVRLGVALPADALGLAPGGFGAALELLDQAID
ncbi:MAG: CvpA family protein [Chloroflexota bacterium]|nr:CvpA family protein [Chloroflexota bacterium]